MWVMTSPKATPKPPPSHHKAPPKPHQCDPKATSKPHQSPGKARMYPLLRLCHIRFQAKPASAGFWQADWDIELLWPGGQEATLGGRILRILSVPPPCPHRVPS